MAAASEIRQAIAALASNRFVITVLGKAKRGKSTLVNALLGRQDDLLAPIDKLPASNVLSRFAFGPALQSTVVVRGTPPRRQPIDPSQIRDYVTEERNPDNRKQVECVEISGPFPDFDRDLVLIDTPGTGSVHEYHDTLVRAVIPQSDAVVFLVTARMPIDQDELELLKQLQQADVRKIVFAINRIDQATADELDQAEEHNRQLLNQTGIESAHWHRISAKAAFEGRLSDSGLEPLVRDIRERLLVEKTTIVTDRFVSRVQKLMEPVLQSLQMEVTLGQKTASEREQVRQELQRRKESLPAERNEIERRFELSWERSISEFAVNVKPLQGTVETQLLASIDGETLKDVRKLAQRLPTRIVAEIEAAVRPHAELLEQSLKDACRDLDAESPPLALESLGGPSPVRTREGLEVAAGVLAGGTGVAAGGVLIAATNVAAASAVQLVTTQPLWGTLLSGVVAKYLGVELAIGATATAVPTALPAWAIVAGPVGWTLLGLGALAVPIGWGIGRVRLKDQLRDQVQAQLKQVFQFLLEDRLTLIRRTGAGILEEYRARREREVRDIEEALVRCDVGAMSPDDAQNTANLLANMRAQLASGADSP